MILLFITLHFDLVNGDEKDQSSYWQHLPNLIRQLDFFVYLIEIPICLQINWSASNNSRKQNIQKRELSALICVKGKTDFYSDTASRWTRSSTIDRTDSSISVLSLHTQSQWTADEARMICDTRVDSDVMRLQDQRSSSCFAIVIACNRIKILSQSLSLCLTFWSIWCPDCVAHSSLNRQLYFSVFWSQGACAFIAYSNNWNSKLIFNSVIETWFRWSICCRFCLVSSSFRLCCRMARKCK